MRTIKEARGPWRVWQGEYCVIGFNEATREVKINNFPGRFEANTQESSGDVGAGLGKALDKFLYSQVTDSTVHAIMATVTDYLIGAKHRGSIREVLPHYEHDCEDCVFLGRSRETLMDLYFCEQPAGPFPTIIARWGDEPEANKSGLLIALTGQDQELFEGLEFAVSSGMFMGREHILRRMGSSEAVECLLQAC